MSSPFPVFIALGAQKQETFPIGSKRAVRRQCPSDGTFLIVCSLGVEKIFSRELTKKPNICKVLSVTHGGVAKLVYRAGLSRRRSRVRVPSLSPREFGAILFPVKGLKDGSFLFALGTCGRNGF